MLSRTSHVDHINIDTIIFSSILQLGDSSYINSRMRALAVQRREEIYFGWEGRYSDYPIFREPIPFYPITEEVYSATCNENPFIKVNNIDIVGVSASSLVHVGNTKNVYMEARIKHIRQF